MRQAIAQSVTFEELFERFTSSKKSRSAAYLRGLKYTLPRFPGLHGRTVAEIQPQDIEAEMNGMTASVRNAFQRNLRAVFNFGVKRGWGPLPNRRMTFVIDTDRTVLESISSELRMDVHADRALEVLRARAEAPS